MQFAQSHELVQPGQTTDQQQFDPMNQQFQMPQLFTPTEHEHAFFPSSPYSHQAAEAQQFHNLSPSPQATQQTAFNSPTAPSVEQMQARLQVFEVAKRELEAHLGAQINIHVLPTPVATPQKRTSIAQAEKLDVAPIPFSLSESEQSTLDHSHLNSSFNFNPAELSTESVYESPILSPQALSPHRSFLGSPQHMELSPQTTLLDVEEEPFSPGGSPVHAVSFADLSLQEYNGSIVETGVAAEEVEKYISAQDAGTRQYYCLVEGCNKTGGFNRRENIRAHVQTHLGDRAFRCNVCAQCFVRQNDLKRHHGIHKSMKPFSCECGSRFARHDALTRHKQRGCCSVHASPLRPEKKKPGRPKKHRPELDDRVAKSTRQRQINAERSAAAAYDSFSGGEDTSGSEFSPSPATRQTEFASLDATSFEAVLASSPAAESYRDESPCPEHGNHSPMAFGVEPASPIMGTINPADIG